MSAGFAIIALCLAIGQTDLANGDLPIHRLHVPRDKLGVFLPKDAVTQFRTPEELDRLIAAARLGRRDGAVRKPVSCRMEAHLDLVTRRLIGKSTWSIPASDDKGIELSPWNLTLTAWKGAEAESIAGLDKDGRLLIVGEPERAHEVSIDWELSSRGPGDRLVFEAMTPNCAIATLNLTLPNGWNIRSTATHQKRANGSMEIYLGGASGFLLEAIPSSATDQGRGVLTWQNDQTYRFDETGVQQEALLQFESLHEQVESIHILLDEQFLPELRESTPAQWHREPLGDGRIRWTAEFRRPPIGSFQVRVRGSLPIAEGVMWHPPSLQVERAVPRGETMTFSIAPSLRIDAVTPGKYDQTFAGLAEDKQYRLVFASPGGMSEELASPLLTRVDIPDLASFARRLRKEAEGKEDTPGKRIQARLDEETIQSIEDAAEGETLGDAAVLKLLAALNRTLEMGDLYSPEAFGAVQLRATVRQKLATGVANLSAAERTQLHRWLLEDSYPRLISRRGLSDNLPGVIVVSGRADVEVGQRVLLDLRREQVSLMAEIFWRPVRGTLIQPAVSIPPGWLVSRVVGEPEDRLLRYRSEPAEDGSSTLWLQLAEGLSPGDQFRAIVFTEPARRNSFSEAPLELKLPEIRPLEFPLTSASLYSIYLDPILSYGKEGLPPRRNETVEIRGIPKPPDASLYSFSFASPLTDATLGIVAERPRFVADHLHRVERSGNHWSHMLSIDVVVEQGLVPAIRLVTSRPLPEGLEWEVEGGDNSIQRLVREPAQEGDTRIHYKIELAVPVERKIRLLTSWETISPNESVPLVDLPDCERFQAVIEVASATGQTIDVQSMGLIDADPRKAVDASAEVVLWTAAYVRLPGDASVTLTVPVPAAVPKPIGGGQALVHVRTYCQDEQLIQRVNLRLDCRRGRPLNLQIPGDSHLWTVTVDGRAVQPRVFDGMIEVSDSLSEGPHVVELVYAHRAGTWMGLPTAVFHPPLKGWNVVTSLWSVVRQADAIILGSSAVVPKGSYRTMGESEGGIQMGQTLSVPANESADALAALNHAFAALDPKVRTEPQRALVALQSALPSGWTLIVDRQSLSKPKESLPLTSLTLDAWLRSLGLTATIENHCILVAPFQWSQAAPGPDHNMEPGRWLENLVSTVRSQGTDPTGQFVTPTNLLDSADDESQASLFLPDGQSTLRPHEIWTFALVDSQGELPVTLAFVPNSWSGMCARVLALTVAIIILLRGRYWRLERVREFTLAAFVGVILLQFVGGVWIAILGFAAWSSALLLLTLLLYRWRVFSELRLATTVLLLFCLSAVTASAQERDIPKDFDPYRVLVPYDPLDPERKNDQVVLTDWLLSQLEKRAQQQTTPQFVTRSDYEGIIEANQQIRWRGRLELYASPAKDFPQPVSLGFSSVRVDAVSVDGTPVSFLPPGLNARLDFKLSDPGISTVQVEFVTSITGGLPNRETDFTVPSAPIADIRLLLGDRSVALMDESLPRGMSLKNEEGRVAIVGRSGPSHRVRIRWREGMQDVSPSKRIEVESAHLLNVTPPTRDLFSVFRYDLSDGAVSELSLLLAPELVIRRLDVAGLSDWQIVEREAKGTAARQRQLVLKFESPQTASFDVHIYSMVRAQNDLELTLPAIVPEGAHAENGFVGIRLPQGWTPSDEKFRNAETESVEHFIERWKQLGQVPPDGIVLAKRFSTRPLEWSMKLRRPEPSWSVVQTLGLKPNPHSRLAELSATVDFSNVQGSMNDVHVIIPTGFEVQRVTGDGLYQWFADGRNLTLLPTREISSGWQVRITGRFLFAARTEKGVAPSVIAVGPFVFPGAKSVQTRWAIERPPTHTLQIDSPREVTVAESGTDQVLVNSDVADHFFRLILRLIEPRVDVRSVTVATVDERNMTLDGRFDIEFAQGVPERLEFRVPRFMTGIRWTAPEMKPPRSEIRGRDLIWVLEPSRSIMGPFRVDWQYRVERSGMERLAVPDVSLIGHRANQRLVLLYNLSEARLEPADVSGITPVDLPSDFSTWPAGVAVPSTSSKVSAFRVEANDWRLTLLPRRHRQSGSSVVVNFQEIDIHLGHDGAVYGASRWEIVDQAAGTVNVAIPTVCRIDQVAIGGVPLPFPQREGDSLSFPVFRRAAPQDVYIYWSIPAGEFDGRILLPRITVGTENPTTLLAVHGPAGMRQSVYGGGEESVKFASTDRSSWIFAKLRRSLDSLANAFTDWDTAANPLAEERVIELLARVERLSMQLREAIALTSGVATGDPDRTEVLAELKADFDRFIRRREELLARYDAAPLARRASLRNGDTDDFEWTQLRANGDVSTYFVVMEDVPTVVEITHSGMWEPLRLSSQATIETLTAMTVLICLLMPRLWPVLRLYWPALLLPLGVGWLRWSEDSIVGMAALCLSFLGAAWMIQGWFTQIEPQSLVDESGPTRIVGHGAGQVG